ncbi:MAG: ABC transporter transmembrane domain-containing protein, partial [Steroidobacteraceae bacterium]
MEQKVTSIEAGRPSAGITDSGLISFVLLLRLHSIPADPAQLRHQYLQGSEQFGADEMLRAAKQLGLRARRIASDWDRLCATALPAIARLNSGHFVLAGRCAAEQVLIQDPTTGRPAAIHKQEFLGLWTGELILFSKRSLLKRLGGGFDLSWFVAALAKYRRLLGEVLVASFVLQLLALVTPLFFQVVIDKVLAHQGLTTLNVLAIGLLAVSLFEVVLGGLRTYLFSHTTNRVDVELGARLYGHLQRLPISFFAARPVGTVVARLRELETVRSFITGTALTLCVDTFFTVLF